jgi:hypothetical protein
VAFHGRAAGTRRGADLLVGPALVSEQEDLEVPTTSAVERITFQAIGQFGTLLGGQTDEGRLAHGVSP